MTCAVSVVLPTYNRAATLERAIISVLGQTFTDFELIIVDDKSDDGTDSILRRYVHHDRVRVVTQLERGCAVARNIGVSIARGRYIAFQDSDDEWLPQMLATAVSALEREGEPTGVFYSDMLRVNPDGTEHLWKAPDVTRGVLIDERTLDYQPTNIGMQSTVIRRECFQAVGGFDEKMPRFIDLELFIRISQRYRFHHWRQPLVRYCATEGISTNTRALVVARKRLLEKHHDRLAQNARHLARQYMQLAVALARNGEPLRAWGYALRAVVTSPRWPIRQQALALLRERLSLRASSH